MAVSSILCRANIFSNIGKHIKLNPRIPIKRFNSAVACMPPNKPPFNKLKLVVFGSIGISTTIILSNQSRAESNDHSRFHCKCLCDDCVPNGYDGLRDDVCKCGYGYRRQRGYDIVY
jgi:hypothetical protein